MTSPRGPVERIVGLQHIQATAFVLVTAAVFGAAGSHYATPGTYYAVLGFIVAGIVGAFAAFMVLLAAWIGRGAP